MYAVNTLIAKGRLSNFSWLLTRNVDILFHHRRSYCTLIINNIPEMQLRQYIYPQLWTMTGSTARFMQIVHYNARLAGLILKVNISNVYDKIT
ncbi:hypothetical protein BC936DRAFT_139164 [Jimgerdemannia flammicorona]|uniref:Uncharacterized protein n=1 Tax=Jimgerdemannia flammicorona TaxID=994334 RepID=A0A433BAI5_9FUNG|nr:hypothetical protein BC936DRAFT_139164 [Jimgerdemannia flammicorona]